MIQVTEGQVLDSFHKGQGAENEHRRTASEYQRLAFIAGIMLLEYRATLRGTWIISHVGYDHGQQCPTPRWKSHTKPEGEKFWRWLEAHKIPPTTAYRWMEAAEAVSRIVLDLTMDRPFQPIIMPTRGPGLALSTALSEKDAALPEIAREFRNECFSLLEDKTLAAAIRDVMDGESQRIGLLGLLRANLRGAALTLTMRSPAGRMTSLPAAPSPTVRRRSGQGLASAVAIGTA